MYIPTSNFFKKMKKTLLNISMMEHHILSFFYNLLIGIEGARVY